MQQSYNPSFEKEIYQNWLDKKYFHEEVDGRKKYSTVMPPPNVTGKAHVGHALDNTITDILVRTKRMQGYNVLWVPGTDHAAIATEEVLVKALKKEGLSKEALGREEFLRRGQEWYKLYGGTICEQLKSLGISCDWDRLAFTMDENLNRAVRHVFCEYFNKGLIYKGTRVVNYCPSCRTTISDNENVYVDQTTNLWHIRYPFADGSGYVTVATTRPETIFGDTAVAVNPKDKRYKNLVGKDLILPLVHKKIKLIADDYCEMGFGTGAVKITPAHDPNDYEVGLRHGLDVVVCIGDDGRLTEQAGRFAGLDRIEAREAIEKALEQEDALVKKEKYKNQVGTCERCGSFTEPKISTQWFVKMEELAKPAIAAVRSGEIKFVPKRFEKRFFNWMENIRDWCISRQIWLGHRIPVYTCENGHVFASEDEPCKCPKCASEVLTQESDVLDTWFSSALWPFSVLGYPNKTAELSYYYPTDVLVTGYDIITFWVSKMIFSGIEFMKKPPFKDVVVHGLVRDKNGVKMSKHLGNGIDPMEVVEDYGADSLRLSLVLGMSMGGDVKYSLDKAKEAKIFINKLYQASRFTLQNIVDMRESSLENFALAEHDKWIISQLNTLIKNVTKNIEKYNLGVAAGQLQEFTTAKFCDWYIELAKVSLHEGKLERERTQCVLLYVLRSLLKLLHPFIPFVTEYIYQNLPFKDAESIMISAYPVPFKGKTKNSFSEVIDLIKEIRTTRASFGAPDSKRTKIYLIAEENGRKLLENSLSQIAKLAFGSEAQMLDGDVEEKCVKVITKIGTALLPLGQLVDFEQEKLRLEKELKSVQFELDRSNKMLSNAGFIAKAPQKLVDEEKEKIVKNTALLQKIKADIENLR